jgi:hypothetical protein
MITGRLARMHCPACPLADGTTWPRAEAAARAESHNRHIHSGLPIATIRSTHEDHTNEGEHTGERRC